MSHDKAAVPRTRSFGATLRAIAWSFVGLRRRSDFEVDNGAGMNPVYVLVAALLGTALFIGALLSIVHAVVPNA